MCLLNYSLTYLFTYLLTYLLTLPVQFFPLYCRRIIYVKLYLLYGQTSLLSINIWLAAVLLYMQISVPILMLSW